MIFIFVILSLIQGDTMEMKYPLLIAILSDITIHTFQLRQHIIISLCYNYIKCN